MATLGEQIGYSILDGLKQTEQDAGVVGLAQEAGAVSARLGFAADSPDPGVAIIAEEALEVLKPLISQIESHPQLTPAFNSGAEAERATWLKTPDDE